MARTIEERRNLIRDNVRKMLSLNAEPDEINTYMAFERQTLPGLTFTGLMRETQQQFPEQQPGQRLGPTVNLPLSKLREKEQRTLTVPEAGRGELSSFLAGAGMVIAGEAFPATSPLAFPAAASRLRMAAFGREAVKQATGASAGFTIGDLVEKNQRGEPIDEDSLADTAVNALKAAGLAAGLSAATRGLGEFLAFFRGAGADVTAKIGQKFARETKFEGRPLPARAGEFAPRSAGGKIDRATQKASFSGKLFAKQQGQKVASYLDQMLTGMSGKKSIVDTSNIVARAAQAIRQNSGTAAQRFGVGVGKDFETPELWINQFFSPANSHLIKSVRDGNRALFEDLKASWFQTNLRAVQDQGVKNSPFLLFDGNAFRAWFEGNRQLIRDTFDEATEKAWDGFTAYLKFASPTAKRAFADATTVEAAAPVIADAAVVTASVTAIPVIGPIGAAVPAAWESIMGGLSWAMSRPGNAVYRLFTEALPATGKLGGENIRTARIAGQGIAEQRGLRFADERPIRRRVKGARLPQREERTTDPRFIPPIFKGLK